MEIFLDTSRKLSKLFEIILDIFRNDLILKIFENNSRNFIKFSEILLENFQSISRNLPKFYQKFFEINFDIFRYNSQNFLIILLNIFKLFLKTFGNIFRYLTKFFKTFQNNFRYCINKQKEGMYSLP